MKTGVVIPAKDFDRAKSRLSSCLDDELRASLARDLLERCLAAVSEAGFDFVLVLTDGDTVERLALDRGALVLRDAGPLPLASLIDAGLGALWGLGVERAVVLMADLPFVDAAALSTIVNLLDDTDAVVAPDHRNEGTNALAVRLPAPKTQFGHDDSLKRHLALPVFRAPRLLPVAALSLDLDDASDYVTFRARSAFASGPTSGPTSGR